MTAQRDYRFPADTEQKPGAGFFFWTLLLCEATNIRALHNIYYRKEFR